MFKLFPNSFTFVIVITIFIINLALHLYSLGKVVYPIADEGVYLYSAKLISEGYIPYKDFFLAHPFYLLLPVSIILVITNFDINIFHVIYTAWVFSAIIPLFFISYKLTNSKFASIMSLVIFSTFTQLIVTDTRFFALRAASQPILAWSLFFIFVKSKLKVAGLTLGIFALSLVQNIFLAFTFIFSLILFEYIKLESIKSTLITYSNLLKFFLLIFFTGYLVILMIPNGLENTFNYQIIRPYTPYQARLESLIFPILPNDLPIILTGLGGSVLAFFLKKPIGLFNFLGVIVTVFFGSAFYYHYLTILASGFAIASAFFFSYFNRNFIFNIIRVLIVGALIYYSNLGNLKFYLIDAKTPEFFEAVQVLKDTYKPPLFTFDPIYGLYSKMDLTFHYYAADMRYFWVLDENLKEEKYWEIIKKSNTISFEPLNYHKIPQSVKRSIELNFNIAYKDKTYIVYVRK